MNKRTDDRQWIHYLETPRQQGLPVKIDTILQRRLVAFMNVKRIKPLMTKD